MTQAKFFQYIFRMIVTTAILLVAAACTRRDDVVVVTRRAGTTTVPQPAGQPTNEPTVELETPTSPTPTVIDTPTAVPTPTTYTVPIGETAVYTNTTHGYSLRYPTFLHALPNFGVATDSYFSTATDAGNPLEMGQDDVWITIRVDENSEGLTLLEWVRRLAEPEQEEQRTVAGLPAVQQRLDLAAAGDPHGGYALRTYFADEDRFYTIMAVTYRQDTLARYEEAYQLMVNSFRFLPVQGDIDTWLQRINSGEVPKKSGGESFDWRLGYFLYYGSVESLGVDNLIYNALRAHRRLDTGEVTTENLTQNDQNLLALTEGIEFDPDVDPTEQIGQTPTIREAILDRIVASQVDLSPEEALASNEVVGVFAPPAPEALGAKYLVYTQETPDSDFEFLGVIVASDATSQDTRETYSFLGWEDLPWLGDAAGPFWDDLPAGVSGDPTNTAEGRPGVLLISESMYEEIKAGNLTGIVGNAI